MSLKPRQIISKKNISKATEAFKVTIQRNQSVAGALQAVTDGIVTGNMTNEFTYSLTSEWADLISGASTFTDKAIDYQARAGNTSLQTGIFSRKYFKKGGTLSINISLKILDDGEGSSNPVYTAAKNLSSLSVANEASIANLQKAASKGADGAKKTKKAATDDVTNSAPGLPGAASGGLKALSRAITEISDSGRTVDVQIGNIFHCKQMVITSLTVKFSRQMGFRGPLFGEFEITLETFQAVTKTGSVFGINNILTSDKNYKISIDGEDVNGSKTT